jgi:hypothetical protein
MGLSASTFSEEQIIGFLHLPMLCAQLPRLSALMQAGGTLLFSFYLCLAPASASPIGGRHA